jgi:hypothetical protein
MSRLNRGQRIVAVVGIGAAIFFVGVYLSELGSFIGWVSSAPLARPPTRGLTSLEDLFLWLGLVALWVATSVFLLRSTTGDRPE